MSAQITQRGPANLITERIVKPDGITVSYSRYGEGPPLVLVHGGFSDHVTNWQEVASLLQDRFTVYSIARRGRGETSSTQNHSVEDEMSDVAAVLEAVGEPVFLLGHSYGAVCALGAARLRSEVIRKLVLYEPPSPSMFTATLMARLEKCAESEDWDAMVETFMLDAVQVPPAEVEAIKNTPFWDVWTVDAKATLNDLRALVRHKTDVNRCRTLDFPVLLMIGSESPRDIYLTDALNAVLPNSTIVALEGQAHEGMTTAPAQFVEAISNFLK
ncbi:MAG TPA: alpha/beta hydrolase [Verrucomicrobiae bacterium]|nr:alpha/beta hydrolase [Verrucomicrobiae bacterium]